jgi:hypothetical protein
VIFTFLFKKKKNGAYAISNRLRKYIFASPLTPWNDRFCMKRVCVTHA